MGDRVPQYLGEGGLFSIDGSLRLSEIKEMGIKLLQFDCKGEDGTTTKVIKLLVEKTTRKTIDAFQILMSGGRAYPSPKKQMY